MAGHTRLKGKSSAKSQPKKGVPMAPRLRQTRLSFNARTSEPSSESVTASRKDRKTPATRSSPPVGVPSSAPRKSLQGTPHSGVSALSPLSGIPKHVSNLTKQFLVTMTTFL
jgi:hypothetical protein